VYDVGLCGDYLYCSPRHSLLLHRLLDVLLPNRRRQSSLTMTSVHCMRAQLLCPWLPVMSACMMICPAFGKGTVHKHIAEGCSRAYVELLFTKCVACMRCLPDCIPHMLSIGVCCSCRQILLVSVVQLAHPHLLHLLR